MDRAPNTASVTHTTSSITSVTGDITLGNDDPAAVRPRSRPLVTLRTTAAFGRGRGPDRMLCPVNLRTVLRKRGF